MMGATSTTLGLGYVYWIVAARRYSIADVGLGGALVSLMTAASVISALGLHTSMVQTLPGADAHTFTRRVNGGLTAAAWTGLAAGAVVVAGLPAVIPEFRVLWHDPLLGSGLIVGVAAWTASNVLDYVAIAERASGNLLTRNTLFAVLKIPFLLAPLAVAAGASGIFGSWLISSLISMLAPMWMLRRRAARYLGFGLASRGTVAELLRVGARHHLLNLGNLTPLFVLPILVVGRLSATANAYFYAAWMSGVVFFMVSANVSQSLFAEGSHDPGRVRERAKASARLIAKLLVPLMLLFVVGGSTILSAFGPRYVTAGTGLLFVLILSAIPDAVTNVFVAVLRVEHRFALATIISAGSAVITLALAWALLPSLGIIGAGWAWLAAQLFGCVVVAADLIRARRNLRWQGARKQIASR